MDINIDGMKTTESNYDVQILDFINIAKRHASKKEQSHLSLITNYLKYDQDDIDESIFLNPGSVHSPSLVKDYGLNTKIYKLENRSNEKNGGMPIYDLMRIRASRRDYSYQEIPFEVLSDIIYFSYGKRGTMRAYNKEDFSLRYAPSAGGLQSNDLYVVANRVKGIERGLYYYDFLSNSLMLIEEGYMKERLKDCCVNQEFMKDASAVVILVGNVARIKWKYGKKSYRFVHVDTGIVSENIHLMSTANKIRSCMIAGFDDDKINEFLNLDGEDEFVSLLVTLGTAPWNLKES